MSGDNYCLDTNILIYLLNGDKTLIEKVQSKVIYISFITEIELLSHPTITEEEKEIIRVMLRDITIIEMNPTIKLRVIELRRKFRLKIPDAIVLATAEYLKMPLFTTDKDFQQVTDSNVLLYEL